MWWESECVTVTDVTLFVWDLFHYTWGQIVSAGRGRTELSLMIRSGWCGWAGRGREVGTDSINNESLRHNKSHLGPASGISWNHPYSSSQIKRRQVNSRSHWVILYLSFYMSRILESYISSPRQWETTSM